MFASNGIKIFQYQNLRWEIHDIYFNPVNKKDIFVCPQDIEFLPIFLTLTFAHISFSK